MARGGGGIAIDDPDSTCITQPRPDCERDFASGVEKTERLVGTRFDDELIGNKGDNVLIGGEGADVLCGELGTDTVDYSGETEDVHASLNGNPDMPTDRQNLGDTTVLNQARKDCRAVNLFGLPLAPGSGPRDCVADDGTAGEGDCVGEDIENIIGGSRRRHADRSDPDSLINEAPTGRATRRRTVLEGGPGDDVLDGRYGPDVFDRRRRRRHRHVSGPRPRRSAPRSTARATTGRRPRRTSIRPAAPPATSTPSTARWDEIKPDVENIIGGAGNDTLAGERRPPTP